MARMRSLFAVSMMIATVSMADPTRFDPVPLREDDRAHFERRSDYFADQAGLAPLTSESANEVRIWQAVSAFPAPSYETWSYVITSAQALRCKVTYFRAGRAAHDKCELIGQASDRRALAPLVDALLPYRNTALGCGISDGHHYTLDIVHDGKRFFIQSTNPATCRDTASMAVASLLAALQSLQTQLQ